MTLERDFVEDKGRHILSNMPALKKAIKKRKKIYDEILDYHIKASLVEKEKLILKMPNDGTMEKSLKKAYKRDPINFIKKYLENILLLYIKADDIISNAILTDKGNHNCFKLVAKVYISNGKNIDLYLNL